MVHEVSRGNGDYEAALRAIFDPEAVMERLVTELLAVITTADAVMIGLVEDDGSVRFVRTAGSLRGLAGEVYENASLSGLAIQTGCVQSCEDAASDPRVDREAIERIGMTSIVSVPLIRERTAYGVVDMLAKRAHAFTNDDVAICNALADVLAGLISFCAEVAQILDRLGPGRPIPTGSPRVDPSADVIGRFVSNVLSPATTLQLDTHLRIVNILEAGSVRMLYQPIVNLKTNEMVSVEALARFAGPPNAPPDEWFAAAADVGLGVELEILAYRSALQALLLLPPEVNLAVNIGPRALTTPAVVALLQECEAERVVLELTEHAPVVDYPALSSVIATIRGLGARLAVDDTGAGFSSLAHIAHLKPEFVKLDRWIVSEIDSNPTRKALITALVAYTHSFGGKVIGEGIETAGELRALIELGVDYGQGFYIARPAELAELADIVDLAELVAGAVAGAGAAGA